MSNSIQRDLKKRKLYLQQELKRLECKTLSQNLSLNKELRYKMIQNLNVLPRNSSRVRIQNRCMITGRPHSVYRLCRLSRIKFRELASQGLLMGITKSSW
jgi:small subunit ribosomal protein S14